MGLPQLLEAGLHEVEGTGQVDPQEAVPGLAGQLLEAAGREVVAGCADQDVQPVESLQESRDGGAIADVQGHRTAPAHALHISSGGFQTVCDGGADPRGGARDHGGLAGQLRQGRS